MNQLSIAASLVDRFDVPTALRETVDHPCTLLPSRTAEEAVDSNFEDAVEYLNERLRSGTPVETAETLFVRKPHRGLRPVQAISFRQHLVFQALTATLTPSLPPLQRSPEDYATFQNDPGEAVGEGGYVVAVDVSSFYDYVDHDLLHDELVAQTGEAEVSTAIRDLLEGLMGRRFGLPQGYTPSDVLSDVVIDIVERRVIRMGLPVWRYNDDFKILADDWRSADRILEVMTAELRAIGLHPNELKSYPTGRDRYRDGLTRPTAIWAEITDAVQADLRDIDLYGEETEPAALTVNEEAAVRALVVWREHAHAMDDDTSGAERNVYRDLANRAIGILRVLRSEGALDFCRGLLQYEPWLSKAVGRYLGVIGEDNAAAAYHALEAIVLDPQMFLSEWQSLWLLEMPLKANEPSTDVLEWAKGLTGATHSSILRARAVLAVAAYEHVELADVLDVYASVDLEVAADVVLAIAIRADDVSAHVVESVAQESPLFRWIVEMADNGTQNEAPPF